MSYRAAAWLAWSLWALCAALIALAGLLDYLTLQGPRSEWSLGAWVFGGTVVYQVLWLAYPTVGAVIASRRPANPVGWLLYFAGLLFIFPTFATAYADYSLFELNDRVPGTPFMATVSDKSEFVLLGLFLVFVLLPLVYPDGRLLSREWRIVAWAGVIGCATTALVVLTSSGSLDRYPSIVNPFGIQATWLVILLVSMVGVLLAVVSWVLSWMSWIVRWQRAQGEERQQLKWFAYVILLIVVSITQPWYLLPIALALFPITVGVAILKHHLYDIDVVIHRTLVYGALTAILVGLYFGGIVVLQAIASVVLQVPFVVLTGEESTLAVVASTLLIAAMFNPLRRRIQSFIDRRFYRSRYDARKTMETFSAKLRDETDLEALNNSLVRVVAETMQPAHVGLWLRPASRTASKDIHQTSHLIRRSA